MPRIRSVKPGFFASLDIAELTVPTRLQFIGLWTYADDQGRGVDDPRLIKAAIWPLDTDVTADHVEAMQTELAGHGRIVQYQVDGRRYFEVSNWHDHQKPNRPQDSTYPAPTDPGSVRLSDHDTITDDAVRPHAEDEAECSQEGRGGERRVEEGTLAAGSIAAALSTACGQDRLPPEGTRARSQLETAAADIAAQGGAPHDVPGRVRAWPDTWGTPTPMAIAKHWPQLVPRHPPPPRTYRPPDPSHGLRAAGLDPGTATA